jgi:hypothetical protein
MRSFTLAAIGVFTCVFPAAAQQGPPAIDPCMLVTRAEAEQVIGKLKADPKPQTQERVKICEYQPASGTDSLEIWVFPESGLERARDQYKDLKPVTDLGQPAFMRRNPDVDWLELFTRKGAVTVEVTMKAAPGAEEKVRSLARKALSRM